MQCYFSSLLVSPSNGVIISSSSLIANIHTTINMICSGLGGPGNTFKWSTGQNTSTLQVTVNNGTSDGGTYTCVVTNAAGNGSASATLYVRPTFIIQPSTKSAMLDGTANFTCMAEAFPPPQYMWMHINGTLGPNVMGTNTPVLMFNKVSLYDVGQYECVVTSNDSRISSNTAYLNGK